MSYEYKCDSCKYNDTDENTSPCAWCGDNLSYEPIQPQDGDRVVSLNDRINDLINAIEIDECGYWTPIRIVSVLKQLPSVEPQDSDLISRQDAIAEIYEDFMTIDMAVHDKSAKRCMDILEKLPSVSQPQNLDYSIILGIDTDHLNELLDGKIINTADVLKGFKNIIDKQGLKGLEHWKTNFGGLINILYDAVQGSSVSQKEWQDGYDTGWMEAEVFYEKEPQDTIPIKAIKGAIDEMQTLVLIEYDDDMTADEAVETAVKQTKRWCIDVVRRHTGVNE